MTRTSFRTSDYARIIVHLKNSIRNRLILVRPGYDTHMELVREYNHMVKDFLISDDFVYPIVDFKKELDSHV
jgi:hypothetical protein